MTTVSETTSRARGAGSGRRRVLVLLPDAAASRDGAIRTEIASLEADHEIAVLTLRGAGGPGTDGQAAAHAQMLAGIEAFAPEVIHAHGLTTIGTVERLAAATGVPFTLRARPADTAALAPRPWRERVRRLIRRGPPAARSAWLREAAEAMASELCLGALVLPFTRPWLARAGLPQHRLVACFPAIRFADFHDRTPNGDAVMHMGEGGGSKPVPDILRLAAKVPGRSFNHYGAVNAAEALKLSSGLAIVDPVAPEAMPGEYKKHRWLVHTGTADAAVADWPRAIAEAQAAGVGVCLPALRPDLVDYVGEGAGILYETLDELPAILSAPVPEEMRERGFLQARKSDIEIHRHLLTDLWDDGLAGRAPEAGIFFPEAAERSAPVPMTDPAPAAPTSASGVASPA